MRHQWQNNQTMSEKTADYGDRYGTYLVGPLIAAGQLIWDQDNGISHVRAMAYTGLVTQVLKEGIGRRRPDGSNHVSMPSGHTSNAFATATALTYSYGYKMGMVAYPIATFVGLSRISDDKHWLSDTVAGAFIGIWLGRASSYSTQELKSQLETSWNFVPVIESGRQGFLLSVWF
ncbi:MAG: phosphatase PAP2 family protein [Pseudobdellovibrionaceae bacterium]